MDIKMLLVSVVVACAAITGTSVFAEPASSVQSSGPLTAEQKAQLEPLYAQMFEMHKAIISKYVEFGVLSEEKGKKKLARLEKHQAKLKENGYIPMPKKDKHGKGH